MAKLTSKKTVVPVPPYVLLVYKGNWVDEMNVAGFLVVTEGYWDLRRDELNAYRNEVNLCIGTNEYLDWKSGRDIVDQISVTPLTAELIPHYQTQFPLQYYPGNIGVARDPNIIAGFGEVGFLDNISIGRSQT